MRNLFPFQGTIAINNSLCVDKCILLLPKVINTTTIVSIHKILIPFYIKYSIFFHIEIYHNNILFCACNGTSVSKKSIKIVLLFMHVKNIFLHAIGILFYKL